MKQTEKAVVTLYILILIFQLSASGTHLIAKSVTYELHPALLMLLRASIAATVYVIWMLFNRKKLIKIERSDWKTVLLLGLLNIPLNQFLFLTAVKLTTAPNVSLAYALTPAFVMILAISFFNEKASLQKIIGVIIAFTGTLFILFERGIDLSSDNFWGFVIVLSASFFYALYTIIGRDFSIKYGPIYSMGITMISGWILFLPIFFITGVPIELSTISATNWLQVLYLGVITSGVGYGLWYIILTRTEASKAAVFNNLQPVFTTILAVIIFANAVTIPFILGGLLIIGGVITTQRG
jgi:drug/metabolite transporter (DMT)-like permease